MGGEIRVWDGELVSNGQTYNHREVTVTVIDYLLVVIQELTEYFNSVTFFNCSTITIAPIK